MTSQCLAECLVVAAELRQSQYSTASMEVVFRNQRNWGTREGSRGCRKAGFTRNTCTARLRRLARCVMDSSPEENGGGAQADHGFVQKDGCIR